jgi:hypothetical protein
MVYQPMLELLAALESHGFTNCIVSGGGTEFVRAISQQLYGIPSERVVGTLVTYELVENGGRRLLLRTAAVQGKMNEGGAKIENIQTMLGRRPLLAAGNSPGDADMLEYTNSSELPSLALLVNPDDYRREYAYESVAGSFESPVPIGRDGDQARLDSDQHEGRPGNRLPRPLNHAQHRIRSAADGSGGVDHDEVVPPKPLEELRRRTAQVTKRPFIIELLDDPPGFGVQEEHKIPVGVGSVDQHGGDPRR